VKACGISATIPERADRPRRSSRAVTVWSLVTCNGTLPVWWRRRRKIAAEEFGAHDLAAARQQAIVEKVRSSIMRK